MNPVKSSIISIILFFTYIGASAQNFRQSIGIHVAEYPVLYQDQRILSLMYTPGIEFQGRNSYLALTMPLSAGKVIPNHRPLNEYYRGPIC